MNDTQRILANAARGLIKDVQEALANPNTSIDYWATDHNGNTLLHLIAQNYIGNNAELTQLLITVYDRMVEQKPRRDPLTQPNKAGIEAGYYLQENRGNAYVALNNHIEPDPLRAKSLAIFRASGHSMIAASADDTRRILKLFLNRDITGLSVLIVGGVFFKTVADINKVIAIGLKVPSRDRMLMTLLEYKAKKLKIDLQSITAEQLEQLFEISSTQKTIHNSKFTDTKKFIFAAMLNCQEALEQYLPMMRDDKATLNKALKLSTSAECKALLRDNGAVEEVPAARTRPKAVPAKPAQKAEGLSFAGKVLLGITTVLTGGLALIAYGIYKASSKPNAKVAPVPELARRSSSESISSADSSASGVSGQPQAADPGHTTDIDALMAQAETAAAAFAAVRREASPTDSRRIGHSGAFLLFKKEYLAAHQGDAKFMAMNGFEKAAVIKRAFQTAQVYNTSGTAQSALAASAAASSPAAELVA